MIVKLDNYYLGEKIEETVGLKELDLNDYAMFEAAGIKRFFKDEKIYYGPDINFLDSIWSTVIGATHGMIYKISIQHVGFDKKESDSIFHKTLEYLIKEMGKYNKHPLLSKIYIWDSADGNVLLHYANKLEANSVNLFLTSSSIRKQIEHML